MPDTITLLRRRKRVMIPADSHRPAISLPQGFNDQLMLKYTGQIDQLKLLPSECFDSTPHCVEKEHPSMVGGYGGNPGLVGRVDVEKVTILFATEQSNG
jgi:hypothetical protein